MTTLASHWHPIATVDEITEQPRRFLLLDQPLVAFRSAQGVSVFLDLCIHRGTALSLGWVTDGRLTCAYHGWQYDASGACTHIPSLPEGSTIPRKARAVACRVEERYGLVWVAMDEPAGPVPGFPKGEWDDPTYRGFLACRYTWRSSAGRAVENFMDVSHFPFVHEGILGSRDATLVGQHHVVPTHDGLSYFLENEEPGEMHSAAGEMIRWEYDLVLPFTIHLKKITPGGNETLISMAAAPTSEKTTEMFVFIVRNYDLDPAKDPEFAAFTDHIMGQDRQIVESQRPEAIPVDLREELHLKVPDASGIAYRRALAGIAGAGPHGP